MKPLIKWPGGKSREIERIKSYIPSFDRYIEPFFGGGALFFYLKPKHAEINDISSSLMTYYKLVKMQDEQLYKLLMAYNDSFANLLEECSARYNDLLHIYRLIEKSEINEEKLTVCLSNYIDSVCEKIFNEFGAVLLIDSIKFRTKLIKNVSEKIKRIIVNNRRIAFSSEDLKENLLTGFASGYYMYFRDVYNDIALNKNKSYSTQFKIANFYFIREYCYGSMFRYNDKGEFNIPYGGVSYNKKNFKLKIENIFNKDVENLFRNTNISCSDFESFLEGLNLTANDFLFLDPPYDTDFSEYEGKSFTKFDQERLAAFLIKTSARFVLVIKNTDFIYRLYDGKFNIIAFDKQYAYNVRSRNERNVEHLLITNIPVDC